jgi:UDP-3-O-[3-hydroxymyristoyl] N-acetylglucosamine deacetylase
MNEFVTLSSVGLITGRTFHATLRLMPAGTGVMLQIQGHRLPATITSVVDAQRGVTLREPVTGTLLSIVEHALAAISMSGQHDLEIAIEVADEAPLTHAELPLLDGSAWPWFEAIRACFGIKPQAVRHRLERPQWWHLGGERWILAEPHEGLCITYALNYPHQLLRQTWHCWQHTDMADEANLYQLLAAATFGEVAELPAMHARGLAKGVSVENTLGLEPDGVGLTRPLRMTGEPHYHKMVDFVGDCFLAGHPLLQYQATFTCLYTGHAGHLTMAQQLRLSC